LTVIVAVEEAGVPALSVTCTVSEYGSSVPSKSSAPLTVIAPVDALMAKTLPVLPAVMA
jgi:hypothetical protein